MNKLEIALSSSDDDELDFYLELTTTKDIRIHIDQIKKKAAGSTEPGRIKQALQELARSI